MAPTIFQYWDRNPPEPVSDLMRTWQRPEAGMAYRAFDDESAGKFITESFDARTAAAYASCAVPAMKADFFRYCVLWVYGGVYADADTRCVGPVGELFERTKRGVLFLRRGNVANDFLLVKKPRDGLIRFTLHRAIRNIEARRSNEVWSVTGPGIMTKLYNSRSELSTRLFAGYDILPIDDVRKYLRFNWSLEYKKTEDHWKNAQKVKTIFAD